MHSQTDDTRAQRLRHTGWGLLGLAVALALALPAVSSASTRAFHATTSANWSGYAIHGDGAHFTRASGIWKVPTPTCHAGRRSFSATWVGIGGYALNSKALEQTGTETDCRRNGSVSTSAWYEVVPAPSRKAKLRIRPGDLMAASVSVTGHIVTLTLRDLTSHRHVTKQIDAKHVDLGSAEWIVEAPSECAGVSNCTTLPLADFGTVSFTHASVHTTTGQIGTVTSAHWDSTKIDLTSFDAARFAGFGELERATPTALSDAGADFSVDYSTLTAPALPGGQPPPFLQSRRLR
jgi:hypothetical protein